jgi:6-pyruvoyltetrahydropterin/6-carboxytetrahydropterin synthase
MFTIEKAIPWEMGHRLTYHDGKCYNIHGHSYKAIVTLGAEQLDSNGMVLDFYHFADIKKYIDEKWDHALMLNVADPLVRVIMRQEFPKHPFKLWVAPDEPTAENIARWLTNAMGSILNAHLQDGRVSILSVTVYETATSSATYVYVKPESL